MPNPCFSFVRFSFPYILFSFVITVYVLCVGCLFGDEFPSQWLDWYEKLVTPNQSTSTTDKQLNTCPTVYPQFLQPVIDAISWGRLAQWSTFCLEQEPDLWRAWFLLLQSGRLEHSSFWPSRHYWYQYIQKTTQECTFWSCLPLTIVGAPGRVI